MTIEKLWDLLFDLLSSLGLKLLGAALVLIVGLKLIKWFGKWLRTSKKLDNVDGGVRSFAATFAKIALYVVLFITIAMILGIPTTSFIAALASCFAAIGLALQGSLSNFAGGLMILLFKPFKVGDYITAPGASGTVVEISVVYTVLQTPDNKRITVPNGALTNSVIENYSALDTRRVDMTFTTAYDCDMEQVKALLEKTVREHPKTMAEPEPFVRMTEHGENALVYTVRVWCNAADYWDVKFDITEAVKKAFDANGISIPYPQLDVHLDK